MTVFNPTLHPRGHATNPGSFSEKQHSDAEALLVAGPMSATNALVEAQAIAADNRNLDAATITLTTGAGETILRATLCADCATDDTVATVESDELGGETAQWTPTTGDSAVYCKYCSASKDTAGESVKSQAR